MSKPTALQRAERTLRDRARSKTGRAILHVPRHQRTADRLMGLHLIGKTKRGFTFYTVKGKRVAWRKSTKQARYLYGNSQRVNLKVNGKLLALISLKPLPTKFVRTIRWKDSRGRTRKQKVTIRFRSTREMRKLRNLEKRGLMPVPRKGWRQVQMWNPKSYRLVKATSVRRESP